MMRKIVGWLLGSKSPKKQANTFPNPPPPRLAGSGLSLPASVGVNGASSQATTPAENGATKAQPAPAIQPPAKSAAAATLAQAQSKAQAKGLAEARQRIAAWSKKSSADKEYDLRGLHLVEVPREIGSVKALAKLNLADNQLTDHGIAPLAGLGGLTWLFLTKNRIGPEGAAIVGSLAKLGTLDMIGNALGDEGAAQLARLPAIKRLILDGNRIGSAGANALARLVKLESLGLFDNLIDDDGLAGFGALEALKKLNLNANRITARGVQSLVALRKLTTLQLANNQIGDDGACAIAAMTQLTHLNLAGNPIGTDGAVALGSLTSLLSLDLSHTMIDDLAFLEGMTKLTAIHLNGARIKSAVQADLLVRKGLQKVYLHQAQLGDVPPELLSKHATDNCVNRLRANQSALEEAADKEHSIAVSDMKVMILGNGRVGKTQMRRRLAGLAYDETVGTTHGVEIVPAELPPPAGAPVDQASTPLKLWDFGGQDIYLGTHALFLKTRAVFPILWTPDAEQNEFHKTGGDIFRNYPIAEWVRFVRELAGPESPVILVQSQCEDPNKRRAPEIDAPLLSSFAWPPIPLRYSAQPGQPQEQLHAALRDALAYLSKGGPKRISARWGRVKAAIEARVTAGDKSMTRAEFDALCKAEKITKAPQRAVLLELLHDFGTVFYDKAVLPDLIILDQNWALQAIYSVFDREAGAFSKLSGGWRGRFTRSDLANLVWNKAGHSEVDQQAFIEMMKSCDVAFELRPASEAIGEALYIAPDLLPERKWLAGNIAFGFREEDTETTLTLPFEFAVPSLLRALMKDIGDRAGEAGVYWRDGFTFYDRETKSYALVEAVWPDRSWHATVTIKTHSGDHLTLADRLREKVRDFADRFGAKIEPGFDDRLRGASDVEGDPETEDDPAADAASPGLNGQGAAHDDGATVAVPGIDPGPAPIDKHRCFISYARGNDGDDTARMRLRAFEMVQERVRTLGREPVFDVQELRHGQSISTFIKLASASPKFVLIISQKYLKSEYCMDELRHIWRECKSDKSIFGDRVRPIFLEGIDFSTTQNIEMVRRFWIDKGAEVTATIQGAMDAGLTVPTEYNDKRQLALDLVNEAPSILGCMADMVHIRDLGEIDRLAF